MSDVPETHDVFKELENRDSELTSESEALRQEFVKLASMNGHGDPVRKRIRRSLRRILEHPQWAE